MTIKQNIIIKKELNNKLETVEILFNSNTMEQIMASEENIKTGRVKPLKSVRDIERFI